MGASRRGVFYLPTLAAVVVILTITAFVSHPYIQEGFFQLSAPISGIVSLFVYAIICISLYYINDSYFLMASDSRILPLIYMMLVLSNPASIYFSKYQIVALLFLWAIYYRVRYIVEEEKKISSIFISSLLISLSSTLLPEMVWLLPILLFATISVKGISHAKYLLVYISAALLPYIYLISINYLIGGPESLSALFQHYSATLTNININFPNYSLSEFFMIIVIGFMAIRSVIFILNHRNSYNLTFERAFGQCLLLCLLMLTISTLYISSISPFARILLYLPLSLLIFAYASHSESMHRANIYMIFMTLTIIIYRLSFFL